MVIEKAKRMIEPQARRSDPLDSITGWLAPTTRQPHSGKILSGGVGRQRIAQPKRFFGARVISRKAAR